MIENEAIRARGTLVRFYWKKSQLYGFRPLSKDNQTLILKSALSFFDNVFLERKYHADDLKIQEYR